MVFTAAVLLAWAPTLPDADLLSQALLFAASNGNTSELSLELEAGADPNARNARGQTALILTARQGDLAGVRLLLGARADVNLLDEGGLSALSYASARGHLGVMTTLLDSGADVNKKPETGVPLAMLLAEAAAVAARDGYQAMEAAIHRERARAAREPRRGTMTPLLLAVEGRHEAAAALLLDHGADVGAISTIGDSTLILAARRGAADTVRRLIDRGAQANAQTWNGDSALIEAVRYGRTEIVVDLLRAGARVDLANAAGESALALAMKFDDVGMVAMLEKPDEAEALADKSRALQSPVRAADLAEPPVKTRNVAPGYPRRAREEGVHGVVVLECDIDEGGRVASVDVLRSIPLLDDAAVDAVRQWRYRPVLLDGGARRVRLTASLTFQLPDLSPESEEPGLQVSRVEFDPQGADFSPWLADFDEKVCRNWVAPRVASLGHRIGSVELEFTVTRDGSIEKVRTLRSAGTSSLDRAAREALVSSKLKPLPDGYPAPTMTMRITFHYGRP